MVVSREEDIPEVNIMLDGTVVEQVHQFVYLGQRINDNGKCDRDG